MPLVIPGITGSDPKKSNNSDWTTKLMGKTLTDSSSDHSSFAKKDLPANHRVVEAGGMVSMDHNPDRLNVHVDKDGTVKNVKWG